MLQFFLGVLVAILTFHINHKVKRVFDIKLLINTLFDVFGSVESYIENNKDDVRLKLMNEIFNIEKMHDNSFYVNLQIKKLNSLKNLYNDELTSVEFEQKVKEINFKKLGRTFVTLTILNLNTEFISSNFKNN